MRKIPIPFFLVLFMFAGLAGCHRQRPHVKLSGIKVNIGIKRFEQDLFTLPADSLEESLPVLMDKYGMFVSRFGQVIHIGTPDDPGFVNNLRRFTKDSLMREVYEKVLQVFPNTSSLEKTFEKSFRYYRYYFPEKEVPEIITCMTGFNVSLLLDEGFLGISLDRYLGSEAGYYDQLGIPHYMQRKMVPEKIPSDCFYAIGQTEFPFFSPPEDSIKVRKNVINQMIYEGKLLYFLRSMMPREKEEILLGFTSDQLKWCRMNEGRMWTYLIENNLLFSTDYLTINKLTRDAPFTSFFPQESPGKAANWIGWQIVKDYMSSHSQVTLKELMNNYNYQEILDESGYSPE